MSLPAEPLQAVQLQARALLTELRLLAAEAEAALHPDLGRAPQSPRRAGAVPGVRGQGCPGHSSQLPSV